MTYHELLLKFTFIALAMVLLSACGTQAAPVSMEASPTPIPTLTPRYTPVPTTTPTQNELRATILSAMNSLNTITYRYRSDTVMLNDEKHDILLEFAPPDRYHIVSDSTSELIVIGQKVYFKQSEGWTESQISAESIIDPDASRKLEESISDIQFIGTDALGGKPMQVYQYKSKTNIGDTESTALTELWLGAVDSLPYKMIVDGETAATDASTGSVVGIQATSTIFFEYDPTIQIVLPTD